MGGRSQSEAFERGGGFHAILSCTSIFAHYKSQSMEGVFLRSSIALSYTNFAALRTTALPASVRRKIQIFTNFRIYNGLVPDCENHLLPQKTELPLSSVDLGEVSSFSIELDPEVERSVERNERCKALW